MNSLNGAFSGDVIGVRYSLGGGGSGDIAGDVTLFYVSSGTTVSTVSVTNP